MNQIPVATDLGLLSLVYLLVYLVITLPPCWKIVRKAGYSPWLSLLVLVPLINVVMLWCFAFADWPILRGVTRPTREALHAT
jgi:hypothetical protein